MPTPMAMSCLYISPALAEAQTPMPIEMRKNAMVSTSKPERLMIFWPMNISHWTPIRIPKAVIMVTRSSLRLNTSSSTARSWKIVSRTRVRPGLWPLPALVRESACSFASSFDTGSRTISRPPRLRVSP